MPRAPKPWLKNRLDNHCVFSPDRVHRYTLIHRFDPLFGGDRKMLWIGLNPSTADENQLDPTLTRIAGFCRREGMDGFWMGNLFGLRTPYPKEMMAAPDPVGPGNDAALLEAASKCEKVIAAWGVTGDYQDRASAVVKPGITRPPPVISRVTSRAATLSIRTTPPTGPVRSSPTCA